MDCVTPSNPTPIAPGESLDIYQLLEKIDIDVDRVVGDASSAGLLDLDGFDQEYWESPSQVLPGPNIEWIQNQLSRSSSSKKTRTPKGQEETTKKKVSNSIDNQHTKAILTMKIVPKTTVPRPNETPHPKYTCDEITNSEM
jgi:hypothetical protein